MTKTEFLNQINKLLPNGAEILTREEIEQQQQKLVDQQVRIKELEDARDKAWRQGVQWAFYMLDGELYNTARQEDVITLPYSKLVQIMEELQSWHTNKEENVSTMDDDPCKDCTNHACEWGTCSQANQ